MHGGDSAIEGMKKDLIGASWVETNGINNEIEEAKKKNEAEKPPPPSGRPPMSSSSVLKLVDKERDFKNEWVIYSS